MKVKSLSILSAGALLGLAMAAGAAVAQDADQYYEQGARPRIARPALDYGARPYRGYGRYGYGTAAGAAVAAPVAAGAAVGAVVTAPLAGAVAAPAWGYGRYGYGASPAAAVTEPIAAGVAGGDYCETSVKTCLLYEPGVLGTGCSCRVGHIHARGLVR